MEIAVGSTFAVPKDRRATDPDAEHTSLMNGYSIRGAHVDVWARDLQVDQRSDCLARALQHLGISSGDVIGVLCCDRHDEDDATARQAARKLGATAVALDPGSGAGLVRQAPEGLAPRVVLACREGGELWLQDPSRRGILISDVPGAYWWRLLEAREAWTNER